MENQGNLTRRDDKRMKNLVWSMTLSCQPTIRHLSIFSKKASLKMLIKLPISAWVHR